ncbi:ferredoxin [Candidatus Dependentiae bacterium]
MEKRIKKVSITPGCISCGTCQVVCSEVFKINGICSINKDADLGKYKEKIKEAAKVCPVQVIKIITDL